MSCSCGAESMDDCTTLGAIAAAELAELGADAPKGWGDLITWEAKWRTLHRATYCLLHPKECMRDAKPKGGGLLLALMLLGAYAYGRLGRR